MDLFLQSFVSGVLSGSVFSLLAVGLSVTWGYFRVLNIAHFGYVLIGAYLTYSITMATGLDPFATMIITLPLLFGIGALTQWVLTSFQLEEFTSLLVTFGLLVMIEGLIKAVWSADFLRLSADQNPYQGQSLWLGDIAFSIPLLVAFALALFVGVGSYFTFKRTTLGRSLRAISDDHAMAAVFGINFKLLAALVGGLGTAIGGIAGSVTAIQGALFPGIAMEWIGAVFVVAVLGRPGNILGAILAGFVVGVVQSLTASLWSLSLSPVATFALLVAVILIWPKRLVAGSNA